MTDIPYRLSDGLNNKKENNRGDEYLQEKIDEFDMSCCSLPDKIYSSINYISQISKDEREG